MPKNNKELETKPVRCEVVAAFGHISILFGEISVALTSTQARELACHLMNAAEVADDYRLKATSKN